MVKHILLCTAILCTFSLSVNAQLVLQGNQPATVLAQTLAGSGVTVSNAVLSCDTNANALFSTPSPNVTNLGLTDGILLTSGNAYNNALGQGVANPPTTVSGINTTGSDPDLAMLVTQQIHDACVLEFDFVPIGDTVKFQYVFGSCEYPNYTCSNYNDVFGFFISGPGITGPFSGSSANIAIVPGTTSCPVSINSINCPSSPGCCNAPSSCFTPACNTLTTAQTCSMFVCNAPPPFGNQNTIVYAGFTIPLTATAVVVPCSTYHLKIAIADALDEALDSGVFLRAGSLTSTAVSLTPVSPLVSPSPYVVEGCVPGGILVSIPLASTQPITIHYQIGGTATNGVDYNAIADSIVIAPGNTTAVIPIVPILDAIPEVSETVTIYRTFGCANGVADSATIKIFDKLQVDILSNDTTICRGDTIKLLASADTLLDFQWSPAYNIINGTSLTPSVYPNINTQYVLTASLANSNCPPVSDTIDISINITPTVNIGPDVYLCKNMQHQFAPSVTPVQTYSYTWTPSTFLSSSSIINPLGNFTTVGSYTYILRADPAAQGCAGFDTVLVEVLPNDFSLFNGDTTICLGKSIQSVVVGDPRFTYGWAPASLAANSSAANTLLTPTSSTTFTLTATYPGCPPMVHDFVANVEPQPTVQLGPDRAMCLYDTIQINAIVTPSDYNNYIYAWSPSIGLNSSNSSSVVFNGATSTNYTFSVTTPVAKCTGTDAISITVWPGDFSNIFVVGSNTICPGEVATVNASGAASYLWQPNLYISDATSPSPIFNPLATTTYTLYATDIHGCKDTNYVEIVRVPGAMVAAGPDVTLYPGDVYTFPTVSNASIFSWTPPAFLDATNIITPTVSNATASTQYVVAAETEYGCKSADTVLVTVSLTSKLNIPNAFTPGNGSSINDYFSLQNSGVVNLQYLRIYNRWGELVFESNNIEKGWDGKYKQQPQPVGTYIYEFAATDNVGKLYTRRGNVTLIR